MEGQSGSYSWKRYQQDVEPIIDRIYLIYCIFSLVAALVQYSIDYNDRIAILINSTFCVALLLVFLLRKFIPVKIKVGAIALLAGISSVSSHFANGVMGTGFLTSLALILTLMIFFPTRVAIIGAFFLLMIPAYVAFDVLRGGRIYSLEIFERMNSIGLWMPILLNLAASSSICIMALDYYRKEIFGQIGKLEGINRDLKEKEITLERYAHYDLLTGLPNRNFFFESLEEQADQGLLEKGGVLLLINIKQFRITNLLLGPELADEVLRLCGEALSGFIRERGDMVCRLMGDEFLVWTERCNNEEMEELRKGLLKAVRFTVEANMSLEINLNFAAARYNGGRDHIQAAYSRAILAMNHTKKTGDGTLVYYRSEMKLDFDKESRLHDDLIRAIEDVEFQMFYQEQRSMDGQKVVGLESLARWKDRNGGYVSPGVFVPIINRTNLILPFGHLTVELVCRDTARLLEIYGPDITVSLNISPVLFLSSGFVDYIREKKRAYGIGDNVLILELTEEIFVEDRILLGRIFSELKAAGFLISLDDFGTGYSSLSYLSRFDFDEVKIDKSLVDNIEDDKKQFGVIEVICRLAETLQFTIVAEGVEREGQMDYLRNAGCHHAQGFLHSKPKPLEELQ